MLDGVSERVPCEKCKRPMSGAAARCPHCSALQARAPIAARTAQAASGPVPRDPARARPVLRDVSPEEARALIAVHQTLDGGGREPVGEPFNILAWMFLPDPRSHGLARVAEIVLTALALPILLGGIVGAGAVVTYMAKARRRSGDRGLSGAVVGLGTMTIAGTTLALGWPIAAVAGACITQLLVLAAREWIRGRSRAKYGAPDLGT